MGFKRPAAHERAAYRCSLPGLAGFTGLVAQGSNPTRRTGVGPVHPHSIAHEPRRRERATGLHRVRPRAASSFGLRPAGFGRPALEGKPSSPPCLRQPLAVGQPPRALIPRPARPTPLLSGAPTGRGGAGERGGSPAQRTSRTRAGRSIGAGRNPAKRRGGPAEALLGERFSATRRNAAIRHKTAGTPSPHRAKWQARKVNGDSAAERLRSGYWNAARIGPDARKPKRPARRRTRRVR